MLKCGPDALRWRPGEPSTCGLKYSPSVNIMTLLPLDRRPWRPQGGVGRVCRWQEYRCVVVYCVQVLAHPVRSFNVSSFEHVCRGRHNLPCLYNTTEPGDLYSPSSTMDFPFPPFRAAAISHRFAHPLCCWATDARHDKRADPHVTHSR